MESIEMERKIKSIKSRLVEAFEKGELDFDQVVAELESLAFKSEDDVFKKSVLPQERFCGQRILFAEDYN